MSNDSLEPLSSSYSSECSNTDPKNDTVEELENAIHDTNALSADAINRLLHQQKRGIFGRTIRWCSALTFHLLISKEKGLTIAESKESAEQSFKTWEENRTVGSTVRKNIHSATLMLVQKLFSFGRSGQQTDIKQLTVDTKANFQCSALQEQANSSAIYVRLQQKSDEELSTDLELLLGASFKGTLIDLYASTCWMNLVANLWGTSFPHLSEVERFLLDKAWASSQVTAECRQEFIRFGSEALATILKEDFGPLFRSVDENAENMESLLIHEQASLYPKEFSVEYTPSSSRFSESNHWEVEEILARKFIGTDRRKDDNYVYLIKWKGYEDEFNSWEKFEDLHCRELVVELKRKERWLRKRNMRLLLEESILQYEHFAGNVQGPISSSHDESITNNILPMRFDFSMHENAQYSRSTY